MPSRNASVNCSELAALLARLALGIADRPNVRNFDDVVAEIQRMAPGTDRRAVAEAIPAFLRSERGDAERVVTKLSEIKSEARMESDLHETIAEKSQRLKDEIAKTGGASEKTRNQTIQELRKVSKELTERERQLARAQQIEVQLQTGKFDPLRAPATPRPYPERTRADAAAKKRTAAMREDRTARRLDEQIADLEQQIATGQFKTPEGRPTSDPTEAIAASRKIVQRLKREISLRQQIESLTSQLESGEFKMPKQRGPRDEALSRLEDQRDVLRNNVRQRIHALKPKTPFERFVRAPFRALGSFITTGEFSAVLNQGGFITLAHPRMGLEAFKKGLSAFASAENQARIDRDLSNRPNAPLYKSSKLFISSEGEMTTLREEALLSHLLEKVPLFNNFTRFHRNFLNVLRADSFDMMADAFGPGGEVTAPEARAIANFVNAATGRGNLGSMEQAGGVVADFAFAPRFYASRLQMLTGEPLWRASSPRVKRAIAGQYARYAVGLTVMSTLMALAGADQEIDPRSTDFGKNRFGNVRLNLLSGFQQFIVFATRMATGQTKTSRGDIRPLRGPDVQFGDRDVADAIFSFLRSKASPALSFATDVVTGADFIGRPMTPARMASRFAGPITYQDIYQVMTSDLGLPHKLALSALAMIGGFVNVYGTQVDPRR